MNNKSSTQEEKETKDDDIKNSSTILTTYHNYSISERKSIVTLYDDFTCKVTAMKLIHSIEGYEKLNERRIKRWKKQSTLKSPGRPISEEFEDEVLLECKHSPKNIKKDKVTSKVNMYSYALVRECANKILNKDYWDDSTGISTKKWLNDSRTSKLQFTNKWILGVLQRGLKKSQHYMFNDVLPITNEDPMKDDNHYQCDVYNHDIKKASIDEHNVAYSDEVGTNVYNSIMNSVCSYTGDDELYNYFDLKH